MRSIWTHIFVFSVLIVSVILVVHFTSQENTQKIVETKDELSLMYENISIYITPESILEACQTILGTNWNAQLTDSDITLYQKWISENTVLSWDENIKYPYEVFNLHYGNHISLHLFEISMIIAENPNVETYIIYVNKGGGRLYPATLTFFGKQVFLSDVTLPKENLSEACKLSPPENVISNIVNSYDLYMYEVKVALSEKEKVSFKDKEEFNKWLLFKTGYI